MIFRSNGSIDMGINGFIGMYELWTAAKFLEHQGNEMYTAAKIKQMEAQDKKVKPFRSLPR